METLLHELLVLIDGEEPEHADYWELLRMAEDFLMPAGATKAIPANIKSLILMNTMQEKPWASERDGWKLIRRNYNPQSGETDGLSLWYHPEMDYLLLQRAFFKED
jgi:hypothetical protein